MRFKKLNYQPRVINFSGGLSSALMTKLEYNPNTDVVIFADTGREHPKTYKFINDFEAHEGIPIIRLTYENEHGEGFSALYKKKKILPNREFRTCTVELKIRLATQYCRKQLQFNKMDWLIGFRVDEQRRIKGYTKYEQYKTPYFPLAQRGIKLNDVDLYWSKSPYTLEIPRILGNCDLCFLKGKDNIIKIMTHYPEMATKWIEDEERRKKTFIQGVKYKTLLHVAQSQTRLFPLDDLEAAYSCTCDQY